MQFEHEPKKVKVSKNILHLSAIVITALVIAILVGFMMGSNSAAANSIASECRIVLYTPKNISSNDVTGFWVPQIACDSLEMHCKEALEKNGMYCKYQISSKTCYCEAAKVVNATNP